MNFIFRFLNWCKSRPWFTGLLLAGLIFVGGLPVVYRAARLPAEKLELQAGLSLYSRDGKLLHTYLNENEQLLIPVERNSVHENFVNAVVATEDQRFYSHYGVDPVAVVRAALTNLRHGTIKSGASTITMQLARLLDPAPRTFYNKFVESLRAVQLERRWSKSRLLEAYVNRLPFGGNLRGIETAARVYFDKTADNLSVAQAAYLAAIPKNPVKFNPLNNHEAVKERQKKVLARMLAEAKIDREKYRKALGKKLEPRRHELPFRAPHLTELLRLRGESGRTRTSLDWSLQQKIQAAIDDYVKNLKVHDVHNLALVVLDNKTRRVLAYLGSQDYADADHGGQVQGPYALRSPGSALKPFLYLKAFADGEITPRRMLTDVPTHYVDLAPENYDHEFRGHVTAARALKQSLNVPAVRLLNRYGLRDFKHFLEKIGFSHLDKEPEYYGLSLVLGGVGVNLMELTNAFATLANRGKHLEPRFIPDAPGGTDALYEPMAPYLISKILEAEKQGANSPGFAYKTGTSADHRDAWTVGWNPEVTVGVWTGNFDGSPARYLLGRRTALPLVRKVFRIYYPEDRTSPWYSRPEGVGERQVCSVSGRPPSRHCPRTTEALYIRGVSPAKKCKVHRRIFVSPDERMSFCSGCIEGHDYKTRVIEKYPPATTRFLEARGMLKHRVPPHNPECDYYKTSWTEVQIISPTQGAVFVRDELSRIPIKVAASQTEEPLYLFLDGKFLRAVDPGETIHVRPEPGSHELTAVDYTGSSTTHKFEVE